MRYQNLTEEEKEKKSVSIIVNRECNKSLSKEQKQKLAEYMRN